MSPRRLPVVLLVAAVLGLLPAPLRAAGMQRVLPASGCGSGPCCCEVDTGSDGPRLLAIAHCPCATPDPAPLEQRAPLSLALPVDDAQQAAPLPGELAAAVTEHDRQPFVVRQPPLPPPVRVVLGIRLL